MEYIDRGLLRRSWSRCLNPITCEAHMEDNIIVSTGIAMHKPASDGLGHAFVKFDNGLVYHNTPGEGLCLKNGDELAEADGARRFSDFSLSAGAFSLATSILDVTSVINLGRQIPLDNLTVPDTRLAPKYVEQMMLVDCNNRYIAVGTAGHVVYHLKGEKFALAQSDIIKKAVSTAGFFSHSKYCGVNFNCIDALTFLITKINLTYRYGLFS